MKTISYYTDLIEQLNRRATRAALGLLGFRNDNLREHLRERFEQDAGMPGSFLADPVFEATFGWQQADTDLKGLEGKLLHADLVKALRDPQKKGLAEDYTFAARQRPYRHQLEAWRALIEGNPKRSVLVSSGTGSGKTECFLIPILHDLASELEQRQGVPLTGVRALFLYPLNALIKSQKDRLVAWTEPFGGKLGFCLYNGDTPDQGKSDWRSEVADRRTLRSSPPPILVTNATMLEYMLVRNEDRSILEQSQGQLRWIVIDEAHTYLGSQAAELTLLLRRVLHAFGGQAGDVHFIATSATLGDDSDESRQRLAEFLADIAGVSVDRVSVIEGKREIPELAESLSQTNQACPDIKTLHGLSPEQRFIAFGQDAKMRNFRMRLTQQPDRLSNISKMLHRSGNSKARHATLELLDLCSQARNDNGEPFLPLRGHLFQRTLNGLWACANSGCEGRKNSRLDNEGWPFGAVFYERHEFCPHCQTPVFDLVQCGECGAEYLTAVETQHDGKGWLIQNKYRQDEDEFQQELESLEDEEEQDSKETPNTNPAHIRLLTEKYLATSQNIGLSGNGQLDWYGDQGIKIHFRIPEEEVLSCPVCNEKDKPGRSLFMPVRLGAPFLLATAIPALLDPLPPMVGGQESRPLDGKRLITFTDNRQGTARFATKLQQESERNYVRSLLYHSLAAAVTPIDERLIEKTQQEITTLEPLAKSNPVIQGVLDQKRQDLAKLKTPQPAQLTWNEAENRLLNADDFTRWMLPALNELAYGQLTDRQLVKLCLLREFFLRPKRRFSLEGLGLVQLHYPSLEKAEPPAVMKQRSVSSYDWLCLLHVAVDYVLRTGGPTISAPRDIFRWLGYPVRPMFLLQAGIAKKSSKLQKNWPSTFSPHFRRNRLVRLLAYSFKLDLASREHCAQLEELLVAVWHGIRPLLTQSEEGFQLELEKQAVLREVREAWFCPVTRRLLPVTFRGITPYLPELPVNDDMALCRKVIMPSVPNPFWLGDSANEANAWLEANLDIRKLRNLGVWDNICDRIALHSRYLRAMEHSAQISGSDLTNRENDFKAGKINLLSCSTTMEMGVDIGGLTAVAMNNVPPHPANFLQRAGRAGRRGETAALSFTMCKATPHGEAVFQNPLWPFINRLALPQVALQSEPIVQRHVNALVLAAFLSDRVPDRTHKVNTGWFFESFSEGESAPCELFADWCENQATHIDLLRNGLITITKRSVLAGRSAEYLLERCVTALRQVAERWRNDLNALLAQQELVKTSAGDSKPEQAIGIQLKRQRGEYLLGVLATLGFLPGYGFPTDVVQLVTTTLEDLGRRTRPEKSVREDNRAKRAGFPSRNLAIAIRDYAPGTDTVLDGRVYRSGGVTLNWQIPAEMNGSPEIQNLRWVWRCLSCGSNGTRLTMPERCPHCNEKDGSKLMLQRYLQPAGFAVDIRCKPHNDISIPQYIPVRDPLISLDGADWMPLPNPAYGRFRSTTQGQLFHRSEGLHEAGFGLCLRCGIADSMMADGVLPPSLFSHKRLRGGRMDDRETICPGNNEDWAILKNIYLGVATQTEVFELQLQDSEGKSLDKITAYTLAIALRRAWCQLLGIEESEIGAHAVSTRNEQGQSAYSIYLYDTATGGAGYVSQVAARLPDLLRKAVSILNCPRNCDSACQGCLLTYDTQHHLDDLNRNAAKNLLSAAYLDALDIPPYLKIFGSDSHLEMEPLILALNREWQRHGINLVRVYLAGNASLWEPLAWRLRDELGRLNSAAIQLQLIAPEKALTELNSSQRAELAALIAFVGAELYSTTSVPLAGSPALPMILEIGSDSFHGCWVASDESALSPVPRWGNGDTGVQYVLRRQNQAIPVQSIDWKKVDPDDLRDVQAGLTDLTISQELNGASLSFGDKAWAFVIKQTPKIGELLNRNITLIDIRYSDRYLRSPLVLLLLRSLIGALSEFSSGLTSQTRLSVQTTQLNRIGTDQPRRIYHDWRDSEDRREVVNAWFGSKFANLDWQEHEIADLPHERRLELIWEDGTKCSIILDQGVGYWRLVHGVRSEFPFESDTKQQVNWLDRANVVIEAGSKTYPTHWYCGHELLGSI
jgi:DEAD/DEAH box helicase domain-containing protein